MFATEGICADADPRRVAAGHPFGNRPNCTASGGGALSFASTASDDKQMVSPESESTNRALVPASHSSLLPNARLAKSGRDEPSVCVSVCLSAYLPARTYPQHGCGVQWPQGTAVAQPVDMESGIAADCTKSEETGSPTMCHSLESP